MRERSFPIFSFATFFEHQKKVEKENATVGSDAVLIRLRNAQGTEVLFS